MRSYLIFCVFLVVLVSSRKCYYGSYLPGTKKSSMQTCDTESNFCIKQFDPETPPEVEVDYYCGDGKTCQTDSCFDQGEPYNDRICCCSKDLCNRSPTLLFSIPVILSLIVSLL